MYLVCNILLVITNFNKLLKPKFVKQFAYFFKWLLSCVVNFCVNELTKLGYNNNLDFIVKLLTFIVFIISLFICFRKIIHQCYFLFKHTKSK